MWESNVIVAFFLTILAGLSTGIGSALSFFTKRTNTGLLSFSLGFSAGVMIYVSFVELFFKARETLITEMGKTEGNFAVAAAFFSGIFFIGIIDRMVPSFENPHEIRLVEDMSIKAKDKRDEKLLRMGVLSALAIGIHNFPEGIATFVAGLSDITLGISIAIAVAIHNIPEGIAVSIPIFYATGNKKRAFWFSFMSGLAEPFGALIGLVILMRFFNNLVFGLLFSFIAGIMVFVALDELLPSAHEFGEHHLCIYGLVLGMAVMAISLCMLT
ncbi:MAG TPA: zinc transporter ZupT [Syntrophorhabdaceae bacterium]|nr:zinc transporter ZupT [Syntrophorhabdaceae bacterium]